MTVFLDNKTGDTWSFIFEKGTLDFNILLKGKSHRGILDYQAAHSDTTMPIIVTKVSRSELRVYTWDLNLNKWRMKRFIFEKAISNFFISRNASNEFHLLIELESGSINEIIHLFYDQDCWIRVNLTFSKCKLIDLTYLSAENKLLLTISYRNNRNLETYIWNSLINKWDTWNISFEIPRGHLLSVGYTKNVFHFTTLIKKGYYNINYNSLCINNNCILSESNIIMLPAFYPKNCYLLKDRSLTAIYCTSLKQGYFFFMRDESQWAEAPIDKIASPKKVSRVYSHTGYINSCLAFYELFNVDLKSPILLDIDEILTLLNKKFQITY